MSETTAEDQALKLAESRRATVMRGIKQGAVKGMVDTVVDSMAGPISESIMKNLTTGHPTIEVLEPLGYLDTIRLMAQADKVVTDSGGLRREAYMLGKPIITLINIVWVPSLITNGWKRVCDADKDKIVDAIKNHNPTGPRDEIFGDGRASERIVDTLLKRFG